MKNKIACDCDGVLFNFNQGFRDLVASRYGIEMPHASDEYPNKWNWNLDYMSREQDKEIWNEICSGKHPGFWRSLPTYAWSQHILDVVDNEDAQVYFITSRCGPLVKTETEEALSLLITDGLYDDLGSITVLPVSSHEKKIPILNALGCTHFLDDRLETLSLAANYCYKTKVGKWVMPWNERTLAPMAGMTDLRSVEEVKAWLQ